MIFPKINLETELIREKMRIRNLLNEAHDVLECSHVQDEKIQDRILHYANESGSAYPVQDRFIPAEKIYSENVIRNICIKYRLRFLDSLCYRGDLPYDAILKVREHEEILKIKFQNFKIAAPAEFFQLENVNKDPLLFAEIGKGKYLLIHKWGNDLNWSRKLSAWPLRNLGNFLFSILMISCLIAFSIPSGIMHIMNFEEEIYLRLWLSVHTFIGISAFSIWAGLCFDKSLSSQNWKSKYYNS
ncbi:MAG: hypothetical protein DWQ44_05615 [Bacteroidetes bacterium]|nr:MAG: hypothetical protein DWQ39_09890 [Bacteroidota bacterium]REK34805.1 MAG: hypothetical protein DWQ44_05615 [Bacteroidota bacterium]REK51315.1 MAG: hypothetical protein DWQ48_01535 [Bacteroidota bacterium]